MATQNNWAALFFSSEYCENKEITTDIFSTELFSIKTPFPNQEIKSNVTKLNTEDMCSDTCSIYNDFDADIYEEPTSHPDINHHFDQTIKIPCVTNDAGIVSDLVYN